MKKEISNGSILEIPLAQNYGFAYCQILLQKEIVLLVFDYFSPISITRKELILEITGKEFIMEPKILMSLPKLNGKYKWNLIGNAEPVIDYLLDFGGGMEILPNDYPCRITLSTGETLYYKYQDCYHLPTWEHVNSRFLVQVMTMLWVLKKGDRIEDIYAGQDLSNFSFLHSAKAWAINNRLPHFEIPKNNRYKVLGIPLSISEVKTYFNIPHKL